MSFEANEVVGHIITATEILLQTSMASPSMELLIQILIDVMHEEYVLRRDLYEEARQLQATLLLIKACLRDAETKSINHDAFKIWLRELEALTLDADNVVDELSFHLLHNKVEKMKILKQKVLSCFSSLNHMIARPRNMAVKIKEINMEFMAMITRKDQFSIVLNVEPASEPHASFQTASFTLDPIFVGRDDEVDKLVDVVVDSPHERKFSILTIVGMGGLGKTTLTRKAFNHEKIKAQFGSLVWVHVSQTFDPIILFNKILSSLTSNTVVEGVECEQMILKRLREALKDKTYLLVLDDVWNEGVSKWEDLIDSVFGVTSTMGNAIIMTTRNTQAASTRYTVHTHILKHLSDEDCWSIIKAKAFESGEAPSPGFEMIGRKIAIRCQGLPLIACIVGRELYHRRSENEWNSIERKWFTDVDVDIIKSLRKSFDHLSSSLRKCFTYCSVFPKGRQIKKQELIEMWMAEGFLGADGRNEEMKSIGEMYFEVLLSRSLLQQVVGRNGAGYAMHDLLHDVACNVLSSCTNAKGVSVVRYSLRDERSPVLPKEVAKHLRTLILEGDISGTVFSDFESLHVLTLDSSTVKKLPSSIRKLIHLRNLNISKTSIEKLPDWIDQLHQLQTLRAEGEYLRKLPSTLKYLIQLRHLYIDDKVELPAEIGRLTHLRTLRCFRVGAKNGFKIEELGSLNNLRGNLMIDNLEKVGSKEEAEKAHMSRKENLMELVLKWGRNREGETNDKNVLEGLQPHQNISKLGIEGFKGKRFPLWIMNNEIQPLEIRLSWCSECEEIPTLEHLPNLMSLYLVRLKKVRFIGYSFRNLMKLHIEGLERLESLPHLLFHNNPNLSVLEIIDCPELRELPDGGNSLEELEIWNCPNLKSVGNVTVREGGQPQGMKLRILRLGGVANSMATISGVKSLQGINVDAMLHSCSNSLAHLELRGMEGWGSIPESIRHLTALSELKLENFGVEEFPEWVGSLSSLKDLSIHSCKNLAHLPSAHALHHLAGLQSLAIRDCPKLRVDSEWRNMPRLRIEVDGRLIDSGNLL